MVVVEDMLVTVVEVELEELHPLVTTVLLVVDKVVKQTTHIREVLADQQLVVTLTYLAVVVKWHMEQTEKVVQDLVSGTNLVVHITMPITKKRLLMDNGDLEEVMVTIHKTVLHTITVMVVQAVLSFIITHNHASITN